VPPNGGDGRGFDAADSERVIAVALHHGNSRHAFDNIALACLDLRRQTRSKIPCLENGHRRSCVGAPWEGTIMTIEALIIWLVIGAVAGWLAGLLVKGYGFGLLGNIVVGIVGAIVAGWLLPRIGFFLVGGILAEIVNAVIGAVILLLVIGVLRRAV